MSVCLSVCVSVCLSVCLCRLLAAAHEVQVRVAKGFYSGVGTGGARGPVAPSTLNGPTLSELDRCSIINQLTRRKHKFVSRMKEELLFWTFLNDNTLVTCFILNAILLYTVLLYNLNV